jgi:hypothetical protein
MLDIHHRHGLVYYRPFKEERKGAGKEPTSLTVGLKGSVPGIGNPAKVICAVARHRFKGLT